MEYVPQETRPAKRCELISAGVGAIVISLIAFYLMNPGPAPPESAPPEKKEEHAQEKALAVKFALVAAIVGGIGGCMTYNEIRFFEQAK
jgi:hypothetical protein